MPRTAKELSPEELKQYHLRLNQHFQNRDPVDEALLCRAWQIACQVAVMLYENFGATQVAVFGSLAERDWFSKQSDIDIAVWGLPSNNYFSAVAETIGFSREFKIDLVRFESCKSAFRKRVQSQAITIPKDGTPGNALRDNETNKMKWEKLVQRISEERTKVKRSAEQIREDFKELKRHPLNTKELRSLCCSPTIKVWKAFSNVSPEKDRTLRVEKNGIKTCSNK